MSEPMPSTISAANVEGILESWRRGANLGADPLHIDLANVASVERLAGGLLSTALLGTLGESPVRVAPLRPWSHGVAMGIGPGLCPG